MPHKYIVDALIPYALFAVALGSSLVLFFSTKREMHLSARKQARKIEALEARVIALEAREEDALLQPGPPRPGFNLHRRTQALRLLRRGEDAGHLAAALGVPRGEIELLVRVQEIKAARSA